MRLVLTVSFHCSRSIIIASKCLSPVDEVLGFGCRVVALIPERRFDDRLKGEIKPTIIETLLAFQI